MRYLKSAALAAIGSTVVAMGSASAQPLPVTAAAPVHATASVAASAAAAYVAFFDTVCTTTTVEVNLDIIKITRTREVCTET